MSTQTNELISKARSLPIEERAEIVDQLLESMQPTAERINELWKAEVERRLDAYKTGDRKLVPGDEVFEKVRDRLAK